ncbi:hypothetical protein C0Q16_29495, partial [Klebsiella pneumoniae]
RTRHPASAGQKQRQPGSADAGHAARPTRSGRCVHPALQPRRTRHPASAGQKQRQPGSADAGHAARPTRSGRC